MTVTKTQRLTTPNHPGNGNGPSSHKDDRQDSSARTVTRRDVVERGHLLVRGVGAGIGVTLRDTTIICGQGRLVLERDEVGIEHSQHGQLLLQASGAVGGLVIPLGTTVVAIRTRRASLHGGLRRSLQLGHDHIRGARHDRREEGQPTGEVRLEGDLVAIAFFDRFTGDLHQNIPGGTVISLGGIELTRGAHQAVNALLPLGGSSVGLESM